MSAAPPASAGWPGTVVARGLQAPESGQGRAGQGKARQGKGGGRADGAAHPGRARRGTARRDLFPLSEHRRKAAGGRQGGRPGKVAAAYRRAGPLSASGCRVSHARGRPWRETKRGRQAAEAARASPALRRCRGEGRSAAPRAAAAGPGHGAVQGEGRSLRGAGQRGRAAACMPSGRGAAVRPWLPLQSGGELLPHAGHLEPHPFQAPIRRAGQAPLQYLHICPNIVVGAHGSLGQI